MLHTPTILSVYMVYPIIMEKFMNIIGNNVELLSMFTVMSYSMAVVVVEEVVVAVVVEVLVVEEVVVLVIMAEAILHKIPMILIIVPIILV